MVRINTGQEKEYLDPNMTKFQQILNFSTHGALTLKLKTVLPN